MERLAAISIIIEAFGSAPRRAGRSRKSAAAPAPAWREIEGEKEAAAER